MFDVFINQKSNTDQLMLWKFNRMVKFVGAKPPCTKHEGCESI